jgi:hypothetical protein
MARMIPESWELNSNFPRAADVNLQTQDGRNLLQKRKLQ